MRRFIVNDTFTDEDTGTEYFQGAIYEVTPATEKLIEQWTAEDKIRDPDADKAEAEEPDDEDENEDDDDDKDEPA